jgi:hypothetical protein
MPPPRHIRVLRVISGSNPFRDRMWLAGFARTAFANHPHQT